MKKSSVAVNLFRALCVGSVIFIGGYTIAQGLLNSDNTNVDIGPYEVTFKLDMDDEATNKICTEAIEETVEMLRLKRIIKIIFRLLMFLLQVKNILTNQESTFNGIKKI